MSSNKMDEQEERWGKRNKEKAEIQQLYECNEKHTLIRAVKRTVN